MATQEAVPSSSATELQYLPPIPSGIPITLDTKEFKTLPLSPPRIAPKGLKNIDKRFPPPATLKPNGHAAAVPKQSKLGSIVRKLTSLRSRSTWPNPEESTGTSCGPVGTEGLECWESKGAVAKLTEQLLKDIKTHLDCSHEKLYGNQGTRIPVLFGIYMVGKSRAEARPFLIFSGDREPRRRAMKLIRKSGILDQFQDKGGISIREVSRPPISLLAGGSHTATSEASRSLGLNTQERTLVYYDPNRDTAPGVGFQVYIRMRDVNGTLCLHKATLGCILRYRGKYLAWTAAHPFLDLLVSSESEGSDETESILDFPFEDETDGSSVESMGGPATPKKGFNSLRLE